MSIQSFSLSISLLAERRIGMREIRRAAHHRDRQAQFVGAALHRRPIGRVQRFEKPRIPLDPVEFEIGRRLEPLIERPRAGLAQFGHPELRKGGEMGHPAR